ncbi:MAG: glycosyltransferase family 4 protein [Alphaproteobacteria bacterium]
MRIGLVTADFVPNVGGLAAHVAGLGEALAEMGQTVDVITLPLGDMRERETHWHGMTVHRPAIPRAKPLYSCLLGRWLKRFLQRQPLDIVHVHGLRPLEATQGLKVPVVFTNHTSGFLRRIGKGESERKRLASRLAHIRHVLAPSTELCTATRSVGYDGPVDFIPNGVDIARFTPGPSPLRAQWSIQDDEVVVLLARRLVEKNGVTVFAEAAGFLERLPLRLVFAGDGPERAKVENILRHSGMFDRAVFLNTVPNAEMPDVYRAADIAVLPSFIEATTITGLESMACGVPLVGTAVGGIPALLDHGVTGLLVPPGAPEAIGAAIRALAEDAERRRAMGQKARERVVERFSWGRIAAATAAIYRRYVGTSP